MNPATTWFAPAEPRPAHSDPELLASWRGGSRIAGERLIRRHYSVVERFFMDKARLERVPDLTQETFVTCIEAIDRVQDGERFKAYLLTIAYRVFCAYLRREYRFGRPLDLEHVSLEAADAAPSVVFARRQEQRLLLEGLREIPANYQVVLELHYWEDMSIRDIAEVLGVPTSTAGSRLRRARDALSGAMATRARSPELLESTRT